MFLAASNSGDLPWTTGRCNRLLRPLTAQLKVLREVVYPHLHATAISSQAPSFEPGLAPSSKVESHKDDQSHHAGRRKSLDDPDWMPHGPEKKGAKRMYTNRSMKANPRLAPDARKPGEISMPTPLIARQVKFDDPARPTTEPSACWKFLQTPKKRRFSMLKGNHGSDLLKESTGQQLRHVERLLQAFRGLLQATQPGDTSGHPKTGTRSLMSTCLRQIPAYIDGRQQWEDEENPEKADVSEEIYQQLEDMGTTSGWRPLREVVRAHGVALITSAIAENLLDTSSIEQLVRQCYVALAFDEAEEILAAFAFTTAPLPPPKTAEEELIQFDDARFRGIAAAHAWAERVDGWPFFYRLVRIMLLSDFLPIEWTSTARFKQIWSRIIRNISDSDSPGHAEACNLFHTVISLACGISAADLNEGLSDESSNTKSMQIPASIIKALTTTVSSLSAILAAIFLLPDEKASYGLEGRRVIRHTLESLATEITHYILDGRLDSTISHSNPAVERLSSIVTCAIIAGVRSAEISSHIAHSPISKFIRGLTRVEETTHRQLLNLPAIVCSVAETCGKAYSPKSPENVFQVLQSIVNDLKSYRISPTDNGNFTESILARDWETVGFPSWFLKRLALDAANEFADHSEDSIVNSKECFQFTLSIESELQRMQMPQHDTPFFHKDADYHVGYRWESGISEWVEATPFAASKYQSSKLAVRPVQETSEEEMEEGEEEVLPPSTPLKASTPARPTLSQLLLANTTPDVLANTPASALSKRKSGINPSTPAPSSTPAALRSLRESSYEYEGDNDVGDQDDEDDIGFAEDDTDELAPTSPVRPPPPSPPQRPPRKRARRSDGKSTSSRQVATPSAAFGLDGVDDSEDELSFL
ncbi:hypothetical protein MPH_05479 [Macrophomina phaseolina MS6]|uniref:Uncharacterized protein n=1 Tax=Macrophomina phaseolina (strain MS6) TaxID=1126212 RepID=K2S415_MACPH|nr:hypothetical protein MPH_05479 [Macrophomina phaseolina MS6]